MHRLAGALSTLLTIASILLPDVALAVEPNVGECLAASESSLKFNAEQKLRAERAQLLTCAKNSCPVEIREECSRRIELVDHALPSVVFAVKDGTGKDTRAVKVTIDNELLAERLDGLALTIDPGEHQFTFEIAGQPPLEKRFVILVAQKNRREVITFAPVGVASVAPLTGPAPAVPPSSEQIHGLSNHRIAAIVSAGIAGVGIGVGTAFGLMASSRKRDASDVCPETLCETQVGVDRWNAARTAGNVSTVAFIVGGVGVVGAAALWFTDRSTSQDRLQIGLSLGKLQVRGRW